MTALELRGYQREAITKTLELAAAGVRKQLGVAATGLGKTVVFCSLAEQMGTRALIIAHREELVAQAAAKVRELWPGIDVGIVKGPNDDVHSHVVVASIQTLARSSRLGRLVASYADGGSILRPMDPFGLVVVDEAHHSAADSYRRVLEALHAGEVGGPLLLGVTATPDRGDGKGLDDLFDEIAWTYDMLWGIRQGYLSDLRGLRVKVAIDLAKVKVSRGDYDAGSAGRALEDADAPAHIVKAWREHAPDRRTLVFTPTVALAHAVAAEFVGVGVAAAVVSGDTPADERRNILRAYSAGEVQVVCNCAVLTEGYDEPRTDCIVVARPTKSRALYTQMIGRGTRRHPDKADCLVLDVVGISKALSLITVPSLFGLPEDSSWEGDVGARPVSEVVDEYQAEQVRLGKLKAEEAELFHQVRATQIAWVAMHPPEGHLRRFICPLGKRRDGVHRPTVVMATMADGEHWIAGLQWDDGRKPKQVLIRNVSMETAQGVAEDYVRRFGPLGQVAADAPWRDGRPTAKLRAKAKKWHVPNAETFATAGQLHDAIEAHIARIQSARRRQGKPPVDRGGR